MNQSINYNTILDPIRLNDDLRKPITEQSKVGRTGKPPLAGSKIDPHRQLIEHNKMLLRA